MTELQATSNEVEEMAALVFRQHGWQARYFIADRVVDMNYAGDEPGAAFWRSVGEAVKALQAGVSDRYTSKWV